MKICVWSGSSFEQWYSSYHLMQKLLLVLLEMNHEIWLIQRQCSDGRMPDNLAAQEKLHIVNIPQTEAKKSNFAQRYIKGFSYYRYSGKVVRDVGEKMGGFDVIFLQSNNNAIVPVNVAHRMKTPVVYNVQDIFPIDALAIGKLKRKNPAFIAARWLQARAYKKADRVVAISEDLKKTLVQEGCKNVDVIYNWSYQNDPYDIPDERNHFLLSNGIKREDGFRVVYAGNVGQMMDWDMLVCAAKELQQQKDIKFYIIGEGSGLSRLKQRIREENLSNVLFFNRQPMEYAQDNYCMADVNINPVPKGVIYTCMPSKTATCLLSQKPTVVSMDVDSDMAKRLSAVDQWFVVAPGDGNAMAERILRLYKAWKAGESRKSRNAGEFLVKLGPVENAYKYVELLEEAARKEGL